MATTEERIAQLAQGFGQGVQNYRQGQDRQRQQSMQDEARRRQEAMQAIDVANTLGAANGRVYNPADIAPILQSGDFAKFGELMQSAPVSDKFRAEQARLGQEQQLKDLQTQKLQYETQQQALPVDQRDEAKKLKYSKSLEIPNDGRQDQIKKLSTQNATLSGVKTAMQKAVMQLENAGLSEAEKIKAGQGLLKLLNSAEGADAVGAEEAKRIGSFLEYKIGNITGPGSFIGRDLDLFTKQIKNNANFLHDRIAGNEATLRDIKNGVSLSSGGQPFPTKEDINKRTSIVDRNSPAVMNSLQNAGQRAVNSSIPQANASSIQQIQSDVMSLDRNALLKEARGY